MGTSPIVTDLINNILEGKRKKSCSSGTSTPVRGRKPRVAATASTFSKAKKSDESSSGGQKKTTASVRGRKKKSSFSQNQAMDSDTCSQVSGRSGSSRGSSISNGSKRIGKKDKLKDAKISSFKN